MLVNRLKAIRCACKYCIASTMKGISIKIGASFVLFHIICIILGDSYKEHLFCTNQHISFF